MVKLAKSYLLASHVGNTGSNPVGTTIRPTICYTPAFLRLFWIPYRLSLQLIVKYFRGDFY